MNDLRLIPPALRPLSEDYALMDAALEALIQERQASIRADLAEQLIRACAPTEDAKEQVLHQFLEERGHVAVADELRDSAHRVGVVMLEIDRDVRHTVPIDVHKADPEGVERDIEALTAELGRHLRYEREHLFPILSALSTQDADSLAELLHRAHAHTLDHPLPPHNPLLRWLARIEERLDRIADTSEKYRPGQERIET